MKKFIVLFREPDGRTEKHADDSIKAHQQHWNDWFSVWSKNGHLAGGSGLTLTGRIIKGDGDVIINDIHKNGTEIVGGYLLLHAAGIDEAVEIMKTCPVYEFGGIRKSGNCQTKFRAAPDSALVPHDLYYCKPEQDVIPRCYNKHPRGSRPYA